MKTKLTDLKENFENMDMVYKNSTYCCKNNLIYKPCDEDLLGPHHAQGPILGLHASQAQSPPRSPITKGMLRRIQMGLPQEDQIHHGLPMLFSWVKEDIKI